MTETGLLLAIRDAMLATGRVMLWRNNSGKLADRYGRWVSFGLGAGSPDLVGIVRRCRFCPGECPHAGRFLGVEVKTPSGRLTPEQRAWHDAARRSGALVIVARSVDEALAGLP